MDAKNDSLKAAAHGMEEMAKELQKKDTSFNMWKCLECEGEPEFEHADMMKHLREVHQIDPKTAKGTKTMTMHLDGRDWYQTNYEIVIDKKKFLNLVRNVRNKHTRMY